MASDTISQLVRSREEQTRERIIQFWKLQSFNFSRLTAGSLNSMVTVREMGVTPALWDTTDDSLTETVALSRAYSETVEAETILHILKSTTGKYAQKLTDSV